MLLDARLNFLWDHEQRGNGVADEENEEQKAQHVDVPRRVRMGSELIELVRIVRFEDVSDEEEWQQEAEAAPHPRMESLDRDVHVVTLAERFQSIEDALLVAELQILHHRDVRVEVHELVAE